MNTTNADSTIVCPMSALEEVDQAESGHPLYVLVFGDEEERGVIRTIGDGHYTWDMYARLQIERGDESLVAKFGIDIRILGFLSWDSDDSKQWMDELWFDLENKTKQYLREPYHGEWWSNEVDAIIGITSQATPDDRRSGQSASPPYLDQGKIYTLLRWQSYWADDNLVQHEISHLYYAPDCLPDDCVMADPSHKEWVSYILEDGFLFLILDNIPCCQAQNTWCPGCNSTIRQQAGRYPLQTLNIFVYPSGGWTDPRPDTYLYGNGTLVTVTAHATDYHHCFEKWLLDGVARFGNPITIVMCRNTIFMTSKHDLGAHFSFYNDSPNQPTRPVGNATGYRNMSYPYYVVASDPNLDDVSYEFSWGDDTPNTIIGPFPQGSNQSAPHSWSSLGSKLVQVRAKDSYDASSAWSQTLSVNIVNRAPNIPGQPSWSSGRYVYSPCTFYTNANDPDGDALQYIFDWGDSSSQNTTASCPSGTTASASHTWTRPTTYQVKAKARDCYGLNSTSWSTPLSFTVSQNDANLGCDANNYYLTASYLASGSYKGTLYSSNPSDSLDWYQFYVQQGQEFYITMRPPLDADFDLELYSPDIGPTRPVAYSRVRAFGYSESISYVANYTGNWRFRIYRPTSSAGEGQYTFSLSFPGPGGCPTLFAWNGSGYVDYGVINIHNSSEEDVIRQVGIDPNDVCVHNYVAVLRLREGWPSLNFSESFIDKVRLYAVIEGVLLPCPIISATHCTNGNVLPRLLSNDDWKVKMTLMETIDLAFVVPYQNVNGFIFTIEGCNPFKT
jgi:hypothetical protein